MRRIVIEDRCRHGNLGKHHPLEPVHDPSVDVCPGGSRLVFEGIPQEWVRTAALAAATAFYDQGDAGKITEWTAIAQAALESILYEKET